MRPTRRTLLTAALACAAPVLSRADDLPVIQPITPTSMLNTRYAKFSNPGPYGVPPPVETQLTGTVMTRIFLPHGASAPRPVLFSHAELASPQIYDRLLGHWASHGFAVFAPIHDDSIIASGMAKVRSGADWNLATVVNDPGAWSKRVAQCVAVLNALPSLALSARLRFPDERIIMAGHSFGAFTAQLMLGVKPQIKDGKLPSFTDPRIFGGILLSPQGTGAMGLAADSWSGVKKPLMTVTGNGDPDGGVTQDPNVKIDSFKLSPAENKHLAWFSNINNAIYRGQQVAIGSSRELVLQDLLAVTTAFLKSYGDYDADVFRELAGDYYTKASSNRVTTYYR